MAEIIMYDLTKFKAFLEKNVFSEAIRKKIITMGATFNNDDFSLTKLGPGKMRSGSPVVSLTRNADGTHSLIKNAEPPIVVDGPKVPPKLE